MEPVEPKRPIILEYMENDPKGDRFRLVYSQTYYTAQGRVTVPRGYATDFASVPRWLWSVFPPIGQHNRACVLHDWLYDNRLFEEKLGATAARKFADDELYRRLKEADPARRFRHYCFYYACRWFGRSWWVN